MVTVSLNDFYQHIRKYIMLVKKGEDIIVSEKNDPLFRIELMSNQGKRPFGLAKGEFAVPDDFNKELPPQLLKIFNGASR